jgi:outer membrane murein-binding lipoprotein Lpp
MAGYLHTLDNHYDDLSSHCNHLNSRVESLEQQVKELKKEKASLQECLDIAEGEEANTREAYCWGLVLKCYELRTRQHEMLNIDALRPRKHYFPKDLMSFGRRP